MTQRSLPNKKILGPFTLTMISVSAILSLRNFPIMATLGLQLISFYLIAAFAFLIPSALVCAELSTAFPEGGGIYTWVRAAFGDQFGFIAIWMEWVNNVVAFPATLAMIIMTLSYVFGWHFRSHSILILCLMLGVFWIITIINCLGIKLSSRINIIGGLLGTLLPCALIIGAFITLLFLHKPLQNTIWRQSLWPHWHWANLVLLLTVLSSYSGMQVTAFHAQDVANPQRSFPLSIGIATLLILALSITSALAIALVLPNLYIHLTNGVIESISVMLASIGLTHMTPIIAILIIIGATASLNAWVIAPARGLQRACDRGFLSHKLGKLNRFNMPYKILILQSMITTLLSFIFIFSHSLKEAFWLLVVLTSQFTVLMYALVFTAAIKLRISNGQNVGSFKIPGGLLGIAIVCVVGLITCIFGFILGLIPPAIFHFQHTLSYTLTILIGDFIIISAPLLLIYLSKVCTRNSQ